MSHDSDSGPPRVMGPGHPRIKELRRLLRRRNSRSSLILLEGPRTVGEALAAGVLLVTVIVPESGAEDEGVGEVTPRLARDTQVLVVRDRVFAQLASTVTPQPMLALATRPDPTLPEELGPDDVVLVMVEVADPGNTGTLMRVADAVAARCVVVAGGADPWGDKAVRASAGAVLRVPVVATDALADTIQALRAAGATIVTTDVREGVAHDSGILAPPVAIVLGSEAHGLPPEVVSRADASVRIEMAGRAESLNVAMAGTLLAFEARRERP